MGIGQPQARIEHSSDRANGQRGIWPGLNRPRYQTLFPPPLETLYRNEIAGELDRDRRNALAKYHGEARACLLSHIGPRGFRPAWWRDYAAPRLRSAGRVVQVVLPTPNHAGGGKRGRVEVWSWQSRRNLMRQMGACEWDALLPCLFITLTYPALAPDDGAVTKAHLKAFRKRWERKYRVKCVGAWKMEFQRRGVAHFHLCLQLPESLWAQGMDAGDDLAEIRQWIALAWYEVVGSGDIKHYRAGTECDWVRKDVATYFAGYSCRSCKEYQNTPPSAYPNLGRWWGLWSLKPRWEEQELTQREAIHAKRCFRRLRTAARRASPDPKVRRRRTRNVGWVVGGGGTGQLLSQIMGVIGLMGEVDTARQIAFFRPHRERDLHRWILSDTLEAVAERYGHRDPRA